MNEKDKAQTTRSNSRAGAEKRSLSTDIAIAVAPTAAVATNWALSHFGGESAPPAEQPPKIELPPGAKKE